MFQIRVVHRNKVYFIVCTFFATRRNLRNFTCLTVIQTGLKNDISPSAFRTRSLRHKQIFLDYGVKHAD